jgi:hypothetical protein
MPFKIYPHLEGEKLLTDLQSSGMPALIALVAPSIWAEEYVPNRSDLSALFYYAAGITKRGIVPGGQMYFRAAACTGALYHIELYLVERVPSPMPVTYVYSPWSPSASSLRFLVCWKPVILSRSSVLPSTGFDVKSRSEFCC